MSKCHYKHHEEYGQELKPCKKCGGNITCGPFDHACKKCEPTKWDKCLLCGNARIFCHC